MNYTDGFYYLHCPLEKEPVLVYCYVNPDTQERGFGFNIADGGGFLPVTDLSLGTNAVRVKIVPEEKEEDSKTTSAE